MFQYIGFVWNTASSADQACAQRLIRRCALQNVPWQVSLDGGGLCVLSTGASATLKPRPLPHQQGVVLGALFQRARTDDGECARREPTLHARATERIIDSGGLRLLEAYWGNYVAFLSDRHGSAHRVLRGPASTLPCLHTIVDNVHLYFSWMETCAQLGARTFSVNWRHLARTLIGPLCSEQTDLNEVREVLPGVCEEIREGNRSSHILWNPVHVARGEQLDDWNEATHTLRAVTRSCIHAWTAAHEDVLVGLSGGLDSSITLSCLSQAPTRPRVTCLTHFADGVDSDERRYARLAAEHAGVELIEHARTPDLDLREMRHDIRLEAAPGFRVRSVDRIEPDLARRRGATAIFRGHGGDELFCRNRSPLYVSDFIRKHHLRRPLMELLTQAAIREGLSIWSVLGEALRNVRRPKRVNIASFLGRDLEHESLLNRDLALAVIGDEAFDLPYESGTTAVGAGRLWQISLLSARRPFYGPFTCEGDPENIAPLLSQPLIELCLRIPTYFQLQGRRDRALARAAFLENLPSSIAQRRDKGGVEDLTTAILDRNLPFARELLLDGELVRQALVDHERLEAMLSPSPSATLAGTAPVFDLLGAEIWVQTWLASRTASEGISSTSWPSMHQRGSEN